MTFDNTYPASETQSTPHGAPAGGAGARGSRWLPRVIVWANVVYAVYLTIQSLAGIGLHTGTTGVIGGVFLLLVLFRRTCCASSGGLAKGRSGPRSVF